MGGSRCFRSMISVLSLWFLFSSQATWSVDQDHHQFSHKEHLRLSGIQCEVCHSAALSSQNARDDLLPAPRVCAGCHDGVRAKKREVARDFESSPKTLHFSHQQHLALGNVAPALAAAIDGGTYLSAGSQIRDQLDSENACLACHRGLAEADKTSSKNYPLMADCLVCHPTIDPPFSCELCHAEDAQIKPPSHTPDFIDVHSSKAFHLDKSSCTICHGVGFRCMGCH